MSELIQVFCNEEPPPTVQQLKVLFSEEGFDARITDEGGEAEIDDPEDPSWTIINVALADVDVCQIECWRDNESDEFTEQRDDLLVVLDDMDDSDKGKVITHLDAGIFLINVIKLDDLEQDELAMISSMIGHLELNYKGLTYFEEDGFYYNEDLVLRME